ncbi:hypothetical protein DL89DRAFT_280387 [Linderina pennispora]|uniref:Multicopper oxidase n=1 Tax=Linderina pennispora TaxID=61395 RepID=A0A1Y1WJU2_9FUNG|nr:uncharacterized protein DL89DRAFT_280387 [Linderina pennispora]ORX73851.1 hypothetical protein DL89DRAFT_280387 [Linderina pennispora]
MLLNFLAVLPIALAARVVVNWDVGYVMANRDGVRMRRCIGVNGQVPIPPIEMTVDDTLVLNVHNSLDQPTSVHSHGIFQNGTNYMDGPLMVTECGIPPGESFTYEYQITQTGTFWLHGHAQAQNSDGLRAPLIVRDKVKPYEYDDEYTFALEDWYSKEFAERHAEIMDPTKDFPPKPSFPTALINGYSGNAAQPVAFAPGKTYRVRVINMSTTENFQFSIPGHTLNVIEADGIYSLPHAVDILDLTPGQRYSALVTAKNSNEFNYYYNATVYIGLELMVLQVNPRVYLGLVEYKHGAPERVIDDIELSNKDRTPLLPVDRTIDLVVADHLYTSGETLASVNNITYIEPKIPTLLSALSLGDLAHNPVAYGPQTNAIVLNHMEYIEFNIINPTDRDHPMHIHGHVLQIAEYGPTPGPYFSPHNTSFVTPVPPQRKVASPFPIARDTVELSAFTYTKLRLRADNPGVWIMHCHVATVVEAPDVLARTLRMPEEMLQIAAQSSA